MMNEDEVKNQELTLASIRSDTIQAAKELSELYAEHASVRAEIDAGRALQAKEEESLARANKELEDERSRMRAERKAHEDWVSRSRKELEVLKAQKKEAMSELSRINEWIFSGENRKRELDGQVAYLLERLKDKKALEDSILALIEEKNVAEAERNVVKLDIQLSKDSAENELIRVRKELGEADAALTVCKTALIEEEQKLNDYRNERVKLKRDTDIILSRIEKKYEEAFPGLRMTL